MKKIISFALTIVIIACLITPSVLAANSYSLNRATVILNSANQGSFAITVTPDASFCGVQIELDLNGFGLRFTGSSKPADVFESLNIRYTASRILTPPALRSDGILMFGTASQNTNAFGGALTCTVEFTYTGTTQVVMPVTVNIARYIGVIGTTERFDVSPVGESAITIVPYSNSTGASNDARLKDLSISPGTLKEVFNPDVLTYTADVGNSVTGVTVTANAYPGATVSGAGAKDLVVGRNTISVTVTAEDKVTINTYTITVTRADEPGPGPGGNPGSGPGSGSTSPAGDVPDQETPLAGVFPFVDVNEVDWFYNDVNFMWAHSLMNGTSEMLFSPLDTLTRAMVVTVLYRMEGSPDVSELDNPFSDVADNLWYSDAIKWAADNAIARGFGEGIFRPNENVTREQMATFIFRYADYTNTELPVRNEYTDFADQSDISGYAVEHVKALVQANIVRGKENNRFDPGGSATRAEYAAMLHRFLMPELSFEDVNLPEEVPNGIPPDELPAEEAPPEDAPPEE